MIYALIASNLLWAGVVCRLLLLVGNICKTSVDERQHLEDRLMALTDPDALIRTGLVREEHQPGAISYVDGEHGTSINRGGGHGEET